VFNDIPHVSRSAQQLAVMATSRLTLEDVIKRAAVPLTYDAATGMAVKGAK